MLTSGASLSENRSYVSPKSGGPSTGTETLWGGSSEDVVTKYTLGLVASPAGGGTVTGAGEYEAGTEKQQIAMRSTLTNTCAWRFHQSI